MKRLTRPGLAKISTAILATTAIFAVTNLSACAPQAQPKLVNGLDPEVERKADFYSEDPSPEFQDPIRTKLGSFFLVEHFTVKTSPSMEQAIRAHQPGGVVFWNPDNASSETIRSVIKNYAQISKEAGNLPILFSADYEGGLLTLAASGRSVQGIQRFKKGFTPLAHPIWLGKSLLKEHTDELCRLHARIMARELKSVGINYPLTVTSDLATAKLFFNRGISTNPEEITTCMNAMMEVFAKEKDIIFVTKHFPGLGQTVGDTHEKVGVSRATTKEETIQHVLPFRNVIKTVNQNKTWKQYSIMSSHALFPFLDPDNITTESPKILKGLLRTQLNFQGLLVSDAMWMGDYGKLPIDRLMVTYLKAFNSGLDMLMVPGSKFAPALTFFRAVYDNTATDEQKALITEMMNKPYEEVRTLYLTRVKESLKNIDRVRATLPSATETLTGDTPEPSTLTTKDRARYYELLSQLDEKWPPLLPVQTAPAP
jgi:beta-N-acetylhexosaminidase